MAIARRRWNHGTTSRMVASNPQEVSMSLAANGVRMSNLEPFQISTISDGKLVGPGSFVRAFWDWYETEPNEVVVWAQIEGVRCVDVYELSYIRRWTEQPGTHLICLIMGRPVMFPREYVELIPKQIDWLLGGRKGPCPGSPKDGP